MIFFLVDEKQFFSMSSILLTLNTPDGLILLRKETKKLALNKWVGMEEKFLFIRTSCDEKLQNFSISIT